MSKKSNLSGLLVAIAALVLVIDVSLMLGVLPSLPFIAPVPNPSGWSITLNGYIEIIVAVGAAIGLAVGLNHVIK